MVLNYWYQNHYFKQCKYLSENAKNSRAQWKCSTNFAANKTLGYGEMGYECLSVVKWKITGHILYKARTHFRVWTGKGRKAKALGTPVQLKVKVCACWTIVGVVQTNWYSPGWVALMDALFPGKFTAIHSWLCSGSAAWKYNFRR